MAPNKTLFGKKNALKAPKGYPLPASCSVSSLNEFVTDGNASFLRAARSGNLEKVIEFLKGNVDINTSNANGLNALHLAAKEGHVNVVTELLKRGANVNAATKKGNTALHIASLAGQEEVVRVLIQLGANVNVQSQNGFTPLYMAAQENHDSVVSFLLANGANQSLATEDGFTPLAVALQQGHDKVVAVLLENDTKGRVRLPALHIAAKKDDCKAATLLLQSDHNPDVTSKSGFTPLHIAAHYGNENIAKILLSKGADVNYAAKHQITPLHVASKWGKINMVTLLLEKGANIEAATRDGLTPLHCAARSGHDQVVDLLLEKGAPFLAKTKNGLAPLHMASQGDHVDSARILLYHKAPVDDVTVDYLTALHVAAHCGHVKVAKLLLDRKADPNARALNGFTPLHIACKKNRIKVVELLLKHGASIEATTESGLTPLHVASFMGCMNIVIYLIQNGANPDVPTVRGETPLHLAARANQTDIIRILLRNGASVDARAREEQTPLHIAARLGNVDIVSLLLQHGAAVDAVTKDMYTALHIAAKEDQEEVASALLDHGASLTSTTKKGFTPLHLAAKYGNIKVARLLLQKSAPVDAQGKNGVTPLHVAAHYDHVNVALLLLDKGASPHAMAKNGYTPLHIAAKKNQMDIASTLLEYGANTNSESKAGFTPLHLSSQEGHADLSSLLIENKANVNHKANNGLTPLHLCAQDDRVNVATILVKNGAEIGPQTKAGYTPLHVASHFGQINMVRYLLQNEANVHLTTSHGYTPLHQAAQQGHTLVVNLLLENEASPNVTTSQGQTPLSIAQRLGYISVVETLKVVTETTVTTTTTTVTEEKYKVVAPETMQETFMTDSEDEGGEEAMLGDQSYRYLTADEMKSLGDDSLPMDVTKDEKHHDVMQSVKQFGAPMVEEDKLSPQHGTPVESGFSEKFSPDNIDLARAPVHAGRLKWKTFLVSFMVDARGGAMRGCRHSGVRVIIPPRKASMPMRITCRYLRKEKLIHPPPLMEGEACASRILEMGPVGARFLGPVIIEVPHFASTRGKEREITILRSDTGESWREHTLEASEEAVQEVLNESFEGEELSALEDLNTNRITRILTTDFPQYFAIVTRVRQEVHGVGPEGGMVSSTVVPQVQAIFPEGALTKKIRVGLQAQPIAPELVAKLLGNRVAVSPIVTVEPRRRKFHKPITLTIPVPQAATKGMINQYSGDAPTLRLLCSITGSTKSGGSSKAQWEDVTGSTPLTFVNDCVSFTTTVSARFWLMDCRQVNEVTRFATELYQEAVYVPFMSKFVIFAKRHDPYEAQLRVFCMTDDKEDKTLESQEHFTEVAKSRDVEVLEGKMQFLEFAGNLVPVTKSGEQLKLTFQAFHENRLPFTVRVKDPHVETMGRVAFMKEPKAARGEPPQVPICNLNVALPEITISESTADVLELVTLEKRYDFIQEAGLSKPELIHRADLRLSDIARELDKDWISLAQQLDLSESDVEQIKSNSVCEQSEQALMMLRLWLQKSGPKATGNELEKGLRKINREDIIKNCMFNVELVTDDVEKAVAKVHLDQSGFDVFKEELGSSREASMRRGASLDISYDEQDIMKEAESAAETSSETGSLFERDQISQALTDDKDVYHPGESVRNTDDDNHVSSIAPVSKNNHVSSEQWEPSEFHSNSDVKIHSLNCLSNNMQQIELVDSNAKNKVQENGNDCQYNSEYKYQSKVNGHEDDNFQSSRQLHEFWPPDKISGSQSSFTSKNLVEVILASPASSDDNASPNLFSKNISDCNQEHISPDLDLYSDNSTCLENKLCGLTKDNVSQEMVKDFDAFNYENSLRDSLSTNATKLSSASKPTEISDLGYCSMDKDPNASEMSVNPEIKCDFEPVLADNLTCQETQMFSVPSMSENVKDNQFSLPFNSELHSGMSTDQDISRKIINSAVQNSDLCENASIGNDPSPNILCFTSEKSYEGITGPKYAVTNSEVDRSEQVHVEGNNYSQSNYSEDAKIRRASKTPPPSPVDETVSKGDESLEKLKEIPFESLILPEIKSVNLRQTQEVEIKTVGVSAGEAQIPSGAQELIAKLTESETWPSGDLDTSQVSVSSLPDDEKSEPTTATLSGAAAITTDLEKKSAAEDIEKTEIDGDGSTTHIIQKTTHLTLTMPQKSDDISDIEGGLEDATTLDSKNEEEDYPESPELSFAEKREFFQKLSLSSSSPSATPTHTSKTNLETEIKLDTFVPEDSLVTVESPEESLSFIERLQFFEKSSDNQTVKPEVKEIKKEVWKVVVSDDKESDVKTVGEETIGSPEKEREIETIEVSEKVLRTTVFKTEVSLPLYESKEVLETTFDSNKDTKVEVTVKKLIPGSEMIEICSVENINYPEGEVTGEKTETIIKTQTSIVRQEDISGEAKDVPSKESEREAQASEECEMVLKSDANAVPLEEHVVSDEEYISRAFRSITESSFEVSKATIDAFKKDGSDRFDSRWQRESPDNISVVKETMEPSLGKSEIFICTEETLDSVKKILSVADAESNIVMNETESGVADASQSQEVSHHDNSEVYAEVSSDDIEINASKLSADRDISEVKTSRTEFEIIAQRNVNTESLPKLSEIDGVKAKPEPEFVTHSPELPEEETTGTVQSVPTEAKDIETVGANDTLRPDKSVIEIDKAEISVLKSTTDAVELPSDFIVPKSEEIQEADDQNESVLKEDNVTKSSESSPKSLQTSNINELIAKIEKEREVGLHFEETFSRSIGSSEDKSESCFSSLKDRSIEIEFLPVLEVSEDVIKESVDKTGHEALGTPCSFHKEMSIESQQSDLEHSFEEHQARESPDHLKSPDQEEKQASSPSCIGAVEKAEYEEVEKSKRNLEEIIYKDTISNEKDGKETVQSVQVTQIKKHSVEVYSVPSEKLIEKFSSKKIHIDPAGDSKETKLFTSQKLDQFLDSVTEMEKDREAFVLPTDLAPVHKRTEEWIDQSGKLMMKEGDIIDGADNGLYEDRPPTLDDEQHKRSSPTAESFDDKARVEQCDTDVMMQLLDFVSRNDIELSEVRTEDEAPDIEEDVSPSAEEEICSKLTNDELRSEDKVVIKEDLEVEEKTQDYLKVAENENLMLSPHRSSFDSVTSPSKKDAPSDNVETVVEAKTDREGELQNGHGSRQMHPQSSLEVEVGSHDSDEMRLHDVEKEIVPLSFVEEEEHTRPESELILRTKSITEPLKIEEAEGHISVTERSTIVIEYPDEKELIGIVEKPDEIEKQVLTTTVTREVHKVFEGDLEALPEELQKKSVIFIEHREGEVQKLIDDSSKKAEDTIVKVIETSVKSEDLDLDMIQKLLEKDEKLEAAVTLVSEPVPEVPQTSDEATTEDSMRVADPALLRDSDKKPEQEDIPESQLDIKYQQSEHEVDLGDAKDVPKELTAGADQLQFVVHESYDQVVEEAEVDVPTCAFVNTAFAGAELIDEVEQSGPIRARSPYEVIRDDHQEGTELVSEQLFETTQPKDISDKLSKVTYVTKHVEIRRRPLLQNIPSEISEEDLVEREMSPETKQSFEIEEVEVPELRQSEAESHSSLKIVKTITKKIVSVEEKGSDALITEDKIDEGPVEKIEEISDKVMSSEDYPVADVVTERKIAPQEIKLKSDASESLKTDDVTTPESDTGIPTSPFELISESELSDGEHKSPTYPSSLTLPKSDADDKSQDSVIITTQSQSITEKTISASMPSSKTETSTLNGKDQTDDHAFLTHGSDILTTESSNDAFEDGNFLQKTQQFEEHHLINGPGEVEYQAEYDYEAEYCQALDPEGRLTYESTSYVERPFIEEDTKKSRYSSVSDDVIDSEIGEILNSDQQLEDIIERPVTPEPPKDDILDISCFSRAELSSDLEAAVDRDYNLSDDRGRIPLSHLPSPSDPKAGFAYGMRFEKDILDPPEEAMDIDSDQYSEEKEPPYNYGMRFERDPDMEEEEIPCYGDLYTHEEEDEDVAENGEKIKAVVKPSKDPDFDILAGRKYFSKNVEFDDLSMSSLQEFERLEAEIVSGRKSSIGSVDSFNGKVAVSKSGEHDDVSMSSLTEFERIEKECTEGEKIDPSMQESITQLSEIEEGHESQASEASQENKSDVGREEDLSIVEEYDNELDNIDEIILKAQNKVSEELPFQYLIKQTQNIDTKTEVCEQGDTAYEDTANTEHFKTIVTTEVHKVIIEKPPKFREDSFSRGSKEEDIDQDSLRDELSLKPDSLTEDTKQDFQDSLRDEKFEDVDSLQGDIPDEMRDSLLEERHIEDDSLREMDILPDESSLSLESSFPIVTPHEITKEVEIKGIKCETDTIGKTFESVMTADKTEIILTDPSKGDIMLSSTDSLEASSSYAQAAFLLESESGMSSSLNSAITSEDYTMVSSTDTLEHEGRYTYRYEDIPVDDIEMLIKEGHKVIVDSEGNIQTQYDVKHFVEGEDNINSALSLSTKGMHEIDPSLTNRVHVHSAVTTVRYVDGDKQSQISKIYPVSEREETGDTTYESTQYDPNVEVEEITTTDEFGNPKVIRKIKRTVQTKTQYSSSSSSADVEEKLKEFLREHAAGENAGVGKEEVQEERTTDEKGNVVLIRTVQQQMLTDPEVHSRTFVGPDADTRSQEYVETFRQLEPTDDTCEFEKIDEQGNVVRVTQQLVIKPEVHTVSFSGPDAHQQMEEYMRQWASSQRTDDTGAEQQIFTTVQTSRSGEGSQQSTSTEHFVHEANIGGSMQTSFPPQSSDQVVTHATTTTSTYVTSFDSQADRPSDSTDQTSSSAIE